MLTCRLRLGGQAAAQPWQPQSVLLLWAAQNPQLVQRLGSLAWQKLLAIGVILVLSVASLHVLRLAMA